ncbi:MAG: ABC transporter permease, partial [Hyphomicrobium sp.]
MSERLPHYVSSAPFDVHAVEQLTPEQEKYYLASQWKMIWWRFKRHRVATAALFILLGSYAAIVIVEFLAPYNLHTRHIDYI